MKLTTAAASAALLATTVGAFSSRLPRRGDVGSPAGPAFLLGGTTSSSSTSSSSLSRPDGGLSDNDFDFVFVSRVPSSHRRSSAATRLRSSATDKEEGETSAKEAKKDDDSKAPRHDVRSAGAAAEMDPEEAAIQARFAEHQQNAPKLGYPTDVRTLVQYNHGFAVMSTNSKAHPGYPGGSVVGFAPDELGRPVFIFSGMSTHTQDLLADPRCSVTIASKEFKGAADGRVNLLGKVTLIPPEEREAAKETYLAKHPGAFWVHFGDFNWFRMDDIVDVRFVGGFARAGQVSPDEYRSAKPDPISAFGMHVANHMNDDHMEATIAMIANQIPGLDVSDAIITSVDSLGMYVKVTRTPRASDQPQQFKLRLPFPRKAEDRKDVKEIIMEMTNAAAASASEESS